jgi:hypothetical protein
MGEGTMTEFIEPDSMHWLRPRAGWDFSQTKPLGT